MIVTIASVVSIVSIVSIEKRVDGDARSVQRLSEPAQATSGTTRLE